MFKAYHFLALCFWGAFLSCAQFYANVSCAAEAAGASKAAEAYLRNRPRASSETVVSTSATSKPIAISLSASAPGGIYVLPKARVRSKIFSIGSLSGSSQEGSFLENPFFARATSPENRGKASDLEDSDSGRSSESPLIFDCELDLSQEDLARDCYAEKTVALGSESVVTEEVLDAEPSLLVQSRVDIKEKNTSQALKLACSAPVASTSSALTLSLKWNNKK